MEFAEFKKAVTKQFETLINMGSELFVVDIDKYDIYDKYLASFPEGTNEIYKERTEHDCVSCKQFIRRAGGIVAIVDYKLVSIWDIDIADSEYKTVAQAMSAYVKSLPINNVFRHDEKRIGNDKTIQLLEDQTTLTWGHLHIEVPNNLYVKSKDWATYLADKRSNFDVLKRSLDEIRPDAAETVLELIEQGSLYRGDEIKRIVEKFLELANGYTGEIYRRNYCWHWSAVMGGASKIRNTCLGTLLMDLSEGKELDYAVKSFEEKMYNYKRTTAILTPGMIKKAQEKVLELGYESALLRRYAEASDITINNVLFADRSVKPAMNVFEELAEDVPTNTKSLDKVEEVSISNFINDIVPKADSIELLLENRHNSNLMSLFAPVDPDSKNMFKWDNNFSWAYNGEMADSIKERVKSAGGNVTGDLRCSLSWFNYDDLDIHVIEPSGNLISYVAKYNRMTGGQLDVDMNVQSGGSRNAVENITWPDKCMMQEGKYTVLVHNYSKRESIDVGFDAEIEFGGVITSFHYAKAVINHAKVVVAEFTYSHAEGIKFISSLPSKSASKEIWNVKTETFNKVTMVMHSPNHWDGNVIGNKHYFFIIQGCNSGEKGRGFFNEFLKEELTEHRKVFEHLGAKLKAEKSDNVLSGVGFSSTQRNHVFFKVSGSFNRIVKVTF